MQTQVPYVDYLVLGEEPHLVAQQCQDCQAHYFTRRNACASCFGTSFAPVPVPTTGTVRTYTIVSFAAPGVPVPYAPAVVDCDGISVRGNLVNVEPSADAIALGMPVRLTTFSVGVDDAGVEAIGYGFEPANASGDK